ncbi:MAG: phage virion morphogenesis protein [Burkholderiaceae bacterium]
MSGTSIQIKIDAAGSRAALAQLEAGLASPTELLQAFGEILQRSTDARFSTQASPEGVPWQSLSPRYQRKKKYSPDKILTLRGFLRSQIRYQLDGDRAVLVGSNLVYSRIHQLGGTIQKPARASSVYFKRDSKGDVGRLFVKKRASNFAQDVTIGAHAVTMPARPFLGLSESDRVSLAEQMQDWMASLLDR